MTRAADKFASWLKGIRAALCGAAQAAKGTSNGYELTLEQLRGARPRLSKALSAAERMRGVRTNSMLDGVRFAGLEELLLKLDEIAYEWDRDAKLERISFLVRRAIGDIETAIEAGLSGFPTVAADSMRDVMEIELLLLDFFVDSAQVDLWLGSDRRSRLRDFSPGALRRRLIELGLHELVGAENVEIDYRAHSEGLHVTPVGIPLPFLAKGHVASDDLISLDSSFVEIFEHGRRLGNALLLAANGLSPDSRAAEITGGHLPAFELAHGRTQEFFGRFVEALREAAKTVDESDVTDETSPGG